MGKTQIALNEQKRVQEKKFWDARARRWIAEEDERQHQAVIEGHRKRPKWVIEHLYEQEHLTPEQVGAARRLAGAIAIADKPPHLGQSALVSVHPAWDLTFTTELERAALCISTAQARETVKQANLWIATFARRGKANTQRGRRTLYVRLFSFPQRSWKRLCQDSGAGGRYEERLRQRVRELLDQLVIFWADMDRGYGPSA